MLFHIVSPQHQSCALLLRMLQCVCRHVWHLVEMRESEILSLPFYLAATILLHQGRPSAGLQRILRAMSRPSISVFRKSRVQECFGHRLSFAVMRTSVARGFRGNYVDASTRGEHNGLRRWTERPLTFNVNSYSTDSKISYG